MAMKRGDVAAALVKALDLHGPDPDDFAALTSEEYVAEVKRVLRGGSVSLAAVCLLKDAQLDDVYNTLTGSDAASLMTKPDKQKGLVELLKKGFLREDGWGSRAGPEALDNPELLLTEVASWPSTGPVSARGPASEIPSSRPSNDRAAASPQDTSDLTAAPGGALDSTAVHTPSVRRQSQSLLGWGVTPQLAQLVNALPPEHRPNVAKALKAFAATRVDDLKFLTVDMLVSEGAPFVPAARLLDRRPADGGSRFSGGQPPQASARHPNTGGVSWAIPSGNGVAGVHPGVVSPAAPANVPATSSGRSDVHAHSRRAAEILLQARKQRTTNSRAYPTDWNLEYVTSQLSEKGQLNAAFQTLGSTTKDGQVTRNLLAASAHVVIEKTHALHGPEYLTPHGFATLPGGFTTLAYAIDAATANNMRGFKAQEGRAWSARNWAEMRTHAATLDMLLSGSATPNWDAVETIWRRMLAIRAFNLEMEASNGKSTDQALVWARVRLLESRSVPNSQTLPADPKKVYAKLIASVAPQLVTHSLHL